MTPTSIKSITNLGTFRYDDKGIKSAQTLIDAGLLKGDELAQFTVVRNKFVRDEAPFAWLQSQMGYSNPSVMLEGDGQYYFNVYGKQKETDDLMGTDYASTAKPGQGNGRFTVKLKSSWMKYGWFIEFRDGTIARIQADPRDRSTYWEYTCQLYNGSSKESYIDPKYLKSGKVKASVYAVPNRLDVGTETNSQFPARRTNQISKVRWSYRITGNIANKQAAMFEFKGNDGSSTKTFVDWDWWVAQKDGERKLEAFLFEKSHYTRDVNGRTNLTDPKSGGEAIHTGASIKQQITSFGNYADYGIDFSMDFWKKTVGDIFYGHSGGADITGWAGQEYMEDFSRAIQRESDSNSGFSFAEGNLRLGKTNNGMTFNGLNFVEYTFGRGHRIRLVHLPYLDDAEDTHQGMHPVSGKPISSHSCYYMMQGADTNGNPNVSFISEKGEAKVQGIYRGLTNVLPSWSGTVGNTNMIDLATERNEASFHERRAIGVHLQNAEYTFWHYSNADEI